MGVRQSLIEYVEVAGLRHGAACIEYVPAGPGLAAGEWLFDLVKPVSYTHLIRVAVSVQEYGDFLVKAKRISLDRKQDKPFFY